MGDVYTNLAVSPSLKIKKLILMLGSHRFFMVWPKTYHGWVMNSRMFEISHKWRQFIRARFAPKAQVKWTKAQRAQNNEFVESGLEIEFQ